MKKYMILPFLILFLLAGCQTDIQSLEDPEIDLFSEFYTGEDFVILTRTNIEDTTYCETDIWINDGYALGPAHLDNYRVHYNNQYYDLQQGYNLGLYSAEDLIDYGITDISSS